MKTLAILIALLLCGCEVHPKAALRRQAAGKLTSCIREANGNELWRKQCIAESVVYCREAKLDASCAYDELITNLPKDRP